MATILEFRVRHIARRPGRGVRQRGTAAEIVIFPGVRYERWEEAKAEPAKAQRKTRGKVDRDTLLIAD